MIWLTAGAIFTGFIVWYGGWRAPLTAAEVEAVMAKVEAIEAYRDTPEIKERLRAFLAADDGREFFMVNLLRFRPQPLPVPGAPAGEGTRAVMERYSGAFMPAILGRAGWLVIGGRAAGPDLERWGVTAEPGWQFFGVVRYRSRRDLAGIITDPRFAAIHPFKFAAVEATEAFPLAPAMLVLAPPLVAGFALLSLALAAQLAANALLRG